MYSLYAGVHSVLSCTIAFLYDYQNSAGRGKKPQTNKHTKWLIPRNYLSKYVGGKKEKKNIRTSHASICHYRNYNNL